MKHLRAVLTTAAPLLLIFSPGNALAWTPPRQTGMDYLRHLENLPYFSSGTLPWQNSSFDPTGANGDGLGCEHYQAADNNEFVILEAAGPGCIEDIWMTAIPAGNIRIYFDGETTPRVNMPVSVFFSGSQAPFLHPLAGNDNVSSGGFFCKVPMAFEKRVRVAFEGNPCYWHILYNRYPAGTPVTTFSPAMSVSDLVAKYSATGSDPKPGAGTWTVATGSTAIGAGQTQSLFSRSGAGAIMALKLDPQDWVLHEQAWLQVSCDGAEHAQVNAPVGMLFGCTGGENQVNGLPLGINAGGWYYCYFPMPYWQNVNVAIYNGSGQTVTVPWQVEYTTQAYGNDAGYFCAQYKREHATAPGMDYLLLETSGTGHYMGASMYFTAPGLEGDERIYVDGSQTPYMYGTGTEDYLLGGWYFNRGAFSLPTHGLPLRNGDQLSMYRFHLNDRIPFTRQITVGIEHGGVNDVACNYSSVAYYYWRPFISTFITDRLDVANAQSESAHGYSNTGQIWQGSASGAYDGDWDWLTSSDDGRRFRQGVSQFNLTLAAPNTGLQLRRRTHQGWNRQRSTVLVENRLVGDWENTYYNTNKIWRDATCFVPPDWTQGRTSVGVQVRSNDLNEFRYWAESLVEPQSMQTWQAESLTPTGSSGAPWTVQGRTDTNWHWGGNAVGEYQAAGSGHWITLSVPVAQAGWYGAWATMSRTPWYGICRLTVAGQAALEPADLYGAAYRVGPIACPGVVRWLEAGQCTFRFDVEGKFGDSGNYYIAVDALHLARLGSPLPTTTPAPVTLLPTTTPTVPPQQALLNPGFEGGAGSGGAGMYWQGFIDAGYGAQLQLRSDTKRSGTWSQGVSLPTYTRDNLNPGVYQRLPVSFGHTYQITAYALTTYEGSENNSWDHVMARLGVNPLGDTAFRSNWTKVVEFNSAHWVWHSATTQVTAQSDYLTVFLTGWRKTPSGTAGWAFFDDVSIVDLTPPTSTPTPGTMTPTATATVRFCPGDASRDGFVSGIDYRAVRDNFGHAGCGVGDADGDCFVSGADYRAVRDNYGILCP